MANFPSITSAGAFESPKVQAQVTALSAVQSLYYNSSDSNWYTQPAGAGTKVTTRPNVNRIDWIGAPATASISMMTTADLRMDAAS